MAITKGAKKAHRQSLKRRVFNLRRARAMGESIKNVRKLLSSGNKDEAQKLLPTTYKTIDKAAKRGIIKKNTASRKKSRLAAALKRTS